MKRKYRIVKLRDNSYAIQSKGFFFWSLEYEYGNYEGIYYIKTFKEYEEAKHYIETLKYRWNDIMEILEEIPPKPKFYDSKIIAKEEIDSFPPAPSPSF